MQNFDLERELREQSEKDHKFGAALSLDSIVYIPNEEREIWMPKGEGQFSKNADFNDCATESPTNECEALLTYHFHHGMLPENKQWFRDIGFVEMENGREVIKLSNRFNAILSGTTKEGNSLKAPLDSMRKNGFIPHSMLKKSDDMSWEEYMNPDSITQKMRDIGQQFIARFTLNYEQVSVKDFETALAKYMLGVAGFGWPKSVDGVYPAEPERNFNHAFLLYKLPRWQAFDSYAEFNPGTGVMEGEDYTKTLDPNYPFFEYGYRVIISKEMSGEMIEKQATLFTIALQWLAKIFVWLKTDRSQPMPPPPPEILPTPTPEAPTPAPAPKISKIQTWAKAIQIQEGGQPQHLNMRLNNPGNLKYTEYVASLAPGCKRGPAGNDGGWFAQWDTYDHGFQALCQFLRDAANNELKYYKNCTLDTFTEIYARPVNKNYVKNVARALQAIDPEITINTPIKILLDA